MKDCVDIAAIARRLKKIEGQIRGIQKMIDDDKNCEDILIQIGAAKSALHKTGQVILEGHLRHCLLDGINEGDEERVLKRFTVALEQFSRMV